MEPLITSMDLSPPYDANEATTVARLVSGVVRGYCGWHIAPIITEEVVAEGRGGRTLLLPTLRLAGLPTLAVDGLPYVAGIGWSRRGIIRLSSGYAWGTGYGSVVVTMSHGYPETPEDVVAVCVSMARRAMSNPEVLRQETVAGYSATYAVESGASVFGVTQGERAILGHYRLVPSP